MVNVYAIRIDDSIDDYTYRQLLSYISKEKYERIKKFYFMEDAKRALYGNLLVRHLACNKLNVANNELIFKCNEFGKPFLQGCSDFHFNISHSGIWVVCAIGKKEVGIDIEQIKSIDFDIAKRFFSNTEYEMLMSKPDDLKTNYFYDIWTLKESYIKCTGKGLSVPLNSFNVCIDNHTVDAVPNKFPDLYLFQLSLDIEYKLSVCSKDSSLSEKINIIDINFIKEALTHGNQRKNH